MHSSLKSLKQIEFRIETIIIKSFLKKIDDTMDEVCEYFHALQALKRLSPPVQPVAVGKPIQVEM